MLSYLSGVNQNNLKNNNMNRNEELGIYYPDAEIGKISIKLPQVVQKAVNTVQTAVNTVQSNVQSAVTSIQDATKGLNLDNAKHNIARVSLTIPRGAFLTLLRLGGALEQTPIKVNLAKRMAEQWASKGTQLKQTWYDLGGDPKELVNVINIASSKPAISGMSYLGFEPVTTTAAAGGTIAVASPIIANFTKILGEVQAFVNDPNNKEIIGLGKKLANQAMDKAKKDNPAETKAVTDIVNNINSTLPSVTLPVTSQQVQTAVNTANNAIDTAKAELNPPQSPKDNKMLYIIGGVAVLGLGALFLMKKK